MKNYNGGLALLEYMDTLKNHDFNTNSTKILIGRLLSKIGQPITSQWVDVNERLPKNKQLVDIFTKDRKRRCNSRYYHDEGGKYFCPGGEEVIVLRDVTHWMEIPQPPK